MESSLGKDSFLAKTWKRCRSIPLSRSRVGGLSKSKAWNREKKMTPEGFIPMYVGPDNQRFAVKTKYVNHPLFTMLLEDAVTECGYKPDGPIVLPCDVDLFYKVSSEMHVNDRVQPFGWSCVFGLCSAFNPSTSRRLGINGADRMGKGYGSFEALTPSRLIKMN